LRCTNCGGELTPPSGKSLLDCPFCDEPMKTPTLIISSENVLKTLVQQHGERVLLDSRLFSFIADKMQNKAPNILKRMRLAINEDVPKCFYDLRSANEYERTFKMVAIITTLIDGYDMGTETAYEIVNYFAYALGFKMLAVPKISNSDFDNNTNAENKKTSKLLEEFFVRKIRLAKMNPTKYAVLFPMYKIGGELFEICLCSEDNKLYLSDYGVTYCELNRVFELEAPGVTKNMDAILKLYNCRKKGYCSEKSFDIIIDCTLENVHLKLSHLIQAISFMLNMKIFYV